MSNTEVKVGKKTAEKTKQMSLIEDLKNFEKNEIPFFSWDNAPQNEPFIIEIVKTEDKFAIVKLQIKNKPISEVKIALAKSLKNQLEQFQYKFADIFALIYLGKKESLQSEYKFHSFVVKKKMGNRFLTTKEYIAEEYEETQLG